MTILQKQVNVFGIGRNSRKYQGNGICNEKKAFPIQLEKSCTTFVIKASYTKSQFILQSFLALRVAVKFLGRQVLLLRSKV